MSSRWKPELGRGSLASCWDKEWGVDYTLNKTLSEKQLVCGCCNSKPRGTVAHVGILSGIRRERKEKNISSSLSLAPGKGAKVRFGSIKEKDQQKKNPAGLQAVLEDAG